MCTCDLSCERNISCIHGRNGSLIFVPKSSMGSRAGIFLHILDVASLVVKLICENECFVKSRLWGFMCGRGRFGFGTWADGSSYQISCDGSV